MRPRVEAGRFQVAANVRHDRRGFGRERDGRVAHHPIHVVDSEPDAFEVEGSHGPGQRFGLVNQPGELILLRNPLQDGEEIGEALLRRLTVVCGHCTQL